MRSCAVIVMLVLAQVVLICGSCTRQQCFINKKFTTAHTQTHTNTHTRTHAHIHIIYTIMKLCHFYLCFNLYILLCPQSLITQFTHFLHTLFYISTLTHVDANITELCTPYTHKSKRRQLQLIKTLGYNYKLCTSNDVKWWKHVKELCTIYVFLSPVKNSWSNFQWFGQFHTQVSVNLKSSTHVLVTYFEAYCRYKRFLL